MKSRILFPFVVCVAAVSMYACNANPATPVAPGPTETTGPDGSTLKANAPAAMSPVNDEKIQSATIVLTAGTATLQFESPTPVSLQYRFQVMNPAGAVVVNELVNGTTYEVTAPLVDDVRHTWRVRAEAQGEAGPWSSTASFITRDPALVVDPLTNGQTVGNPVNGGTFCPGDPRCPAGVAGWMSTGCNVGMNYDIPTCDDCTVEFDITNIGKREGVHACGNDLKLLSMARAGDFSGFGPFRDSPWKVQLIQRNDGDGTGMEIIWRNGKASEHGNPGDHRIKLTSGGPDFRDESVFHFVVKWTRGGYHISFGTNGGPQVPYLIDGFGSHPYAPPNHRVQLGCSPRGESFPAAVYRNVRIYRNR